MTNLVYRQTQDIPVRTAPETFGFPLSNNQIDGNFKLIDIELDKKATKADPIFTGTVVVPTPPSNSNDTIAASTAWVISKISTDSPSKTGTGATGTWNINVTGSAGSLANQLSPGSYISGSAFNGAGNVTWSVNANTDNSANTVVARNALGSFAANVVTVSELNTTTAVKVNNTTVIDSAMKLTNITSGDFDNVVISTNTAAIVGKRYIATAQLVLTLPSGPTANQTVGFSINSTGIGDCTIAGNGSNIMSLPSDLIIDTTTCNITLKYINSTIGWYITSY